MSEAVTESAKRLWTERVIVWAADRNIIGGTEPKDQFLKLVEEFGELATGLQKKDSELTKDAIGDCAVVLAIIAAQCGLRFDECMEHAWNEIKDRRGRVVNGVFVKEMPPLTFAPEMEADTVITTNYVAEAVNREFDFPQDGE